MKYWVLVALLTLVGCGEESSEEIVDEERTFSEENELPSGSWSPETSNPEDCSVIRLRQEFKDHDFILIIPELCQPFYFETGRPPEVTNPTPDLSNPEIFMDVEI